MIEAAMSKSSSPVGPLHPILVSASMRWLNLPEMEYLLQPNSPLPISTEPPVAPPPSGTLVLYDRSLTRNYKDDGYVWVKKRNSPKVREDHVKLRVDGQFRIAGCYVHCENVPTMHRRAYHLLDPETGAALVPPMAPTRSKPTGPPSLVLVHYLDTEKAKNKLVNAGVDEYSLALSYPDRSNNRTVPVQNQKQRKTKPKIKLPDTNSLYGEPLGNLDDVLMTDINNFDVETLNILWDMVMDEGGAEKNMSDLLPTEFDILDGMKNHPLSAELKSEASLAAAAASAVTAFELELRAAAAAGEKKADSILASELAAAVEEAVEDLNPKRVPDFDININNHTTPNNLRESRKSKETIGDSHAFFDDTTIRDEQLPNISDFVPDQAVIHDYEERLKCLICFSDPISSLPKDGENSIFTWDSVVAFVSVGADSCNTATTKPLTIHLASATIINPYTCRCYIPTVKNPGKYYVLLLAVRHYVGSDPLSDGVASCITSSLNKTWLDTVGKKSNSIHPNFTKKTRTSNESSYFSLQLLSQVSDTEFQYHRAVEPRDNENPTTTSRPHHDVPAPPAAMAMVATVLSDFPNPPAAAVVPSDAVLKPPAHVDEGTIAIKDLANDPKGTALLSAALETTVNPKTRKRTATIEIPAINLEEGHDIDDVFAAASKWANLPSTNSDETTKVQEVDRHCKVRFVERLTSVIAGTEKESDGSLLEETDLKNIDDQGLDALLDGLLVRIVESLGHVSPSSQELAQELNNPDKSGFTLLHYAALYNLQSLIPVLLAHGANPDMTSTRGKLAPLHLACSAGNKDVVDLLIRGGCSRTLQDSFGSSPADHAIRNGFSDLAREINNMEDDCIQMNEDLMGVEATTDEETTRRLLLQAAFSNLSLKDKLIINMIVRKRQNATTDGDSTMNDEDSSSQSMEQGDDSEQVHRPRRSRSSDSRPVFSDGSNSAPDSVYKSKLFRVHSDLDVASVISDTDRESLGIAMKLMNEEELQDLERQSDVDADVRSWVLRRNYVSLKEASVNLLATLKKHNEKKVVQATGDCAFSSQVQRATFQSLKNMQSQAIADLVIRKNISLRGPMK